MSFTVQPLSVTDEKYFHASGAVFWAAAPLFHKCLEFHDFSPTVLLIPFQLLPGS
jgi:hypothetical protein